MHNLDVASQRLKSLCKQIKENECAVRKAHKELVEFSNAAHADRQWNELLRQIKQERESTWFTRMFFGY